MHQSKQHLLGYCISMLILLLQCASLQAKETMTVEQAMYHCKTTYPTQFEAKKRLACFDSISTPAIEIVTENVVANTLAETNANIPSNSTDAAQGREKIPEKEAAFAIKKTNLNLSYLERKWRLTSEGDWDISDFETYKLSIRYPLSPRSLYRPNRETRPSIS